MIDPVLEIERGLDRMEEIGRAITRVIVKVGHPSQETSSETELRWWDERFQAETGKSVDGLLAPARFAEWVCGVPLEPWQESILEQLRGREVSQ